MIGKYIPSRLAYNSAFGLQNGGMKICDSVPALSSDFGVGHNSSGVVGSSMEVSLGPRSNSTFTNGI